MIPRENKIHRYEKTLRFHDPQERRGLEYNLSINKKERGHKVKPTLLKIISLLGEIKITEKSIRIQLAQ